LLSVSGLVSRCRIFLISAASRSWLGRINSGARLILYLSSHLV
jgi:hypothetical protein